MQRSSSSFFLLQSILLPRFAKSLNPKYEMSLLGFDSKGLRTKLHHKDTAFAGASSGFMTRAICQPLDVLKIRFQLQLEGKDKAKYKSVTQATQRIIIDEGFGALWKGHVPAQFLSLTYGFGQFLGLELMTQWVHSFAPWTTEREYKPVVHAVCGMPAGALGTFLSQPFDVVRTRLVAQGTKVCFVCRVVGKPFPIKASVQLMIY